MEPNRLEGGIKVLERSIILSISFILRETATVRMPNYHFHGPVAAACNHIQEQEQKSSKQRSRFI
jgi:hypothetical protein